MLATSALGQTTKEEVEEAENRAKIAKAKKEELEARFPAPDATALKGSTSLEGELIESRIQAYKATEEISEKIAQNAQSIGVLGLYVFSESDYAKVISYKKLIQRLDDINGDYDRCYQRAAGAGAAPVGLLATTFLNWLPLLKTDTSIKGASFDIDDETIWASLGSRLSKRGISLASPFVSSFDSTSIKVIPTGSLVVKLERAEASLAQGVCTAPYPYKMQLDAAFVKLKNEIGLPAAIVPPRPETTKTTTSTTAVPPTTTVVETVEQFPATSQSTLVTFWDYLKTEAIITRMQTGQIFWIKIKNIKAGGNVRVKSSPLIDVFRGGSSIKFSGGSLAHYYILDNNGAIRLSGVVNAYVPYKKSSEIK